MTIAVILQIHLIEILLSPEMQITKEEYERRKEEYWVTESRKAAVKPSGMAASWAFRVEKDREFDVLLKQQGIEVPS